MQMAPEDAAAHLRQSPGYPPEEQEPEHVSWISLSSLMESDPERGERLWQRIKDAATLELKRGVRSARTVESANSYPIERARFAAIAGALMKSLEPRDALEELLIQQMACAYELHLLWQERASMRAQQEVWEGDRDRRNALHNLSPRQRDRYEEDHGWMPPRVSTAEAIDQSVMIADRYQRSFLRLMKAFRDNRRLFSSLVVAGGQVNIAEQQVVTPDKSIERDRHVSHLARSDVITRPPRPIQQIRKHKAQRKRE